MESKEQNISLEDKLLISKIRDILLREDRESIDKMRETFDNPEKLAQKVDPIVTFHINSLKKKFPKEFEVAVEDIVAKKLRKSQGEILNVIYPVMGRMMTKFISQQIQELRESIDRQVRRPFSREGLMGKIKSAVTGVKHGDLAISKASGDNSIEEIHIIERDSGLLMASYTLDSQAIDRDVIAGMLTAIKAFVEDAFQKEREELEMIQYGTYRILIQNFHLYYFAIILGSPITTSERKQLSQKILEFAELKMSSKLAKNENLDFEELSLQLKNYFATSIEQSN